MSPRPTTPRSGSTVFAFAATLGLVALFGSLGSALATTDGGSALARPLGLGPTLLPDGKVVASLPVQIVGVAAAAVLSALAVATLVHWKVERPLRRLGAQVAALGRGDLQTRFVPEDAQTPRGVADRLAHALEQARVGVRRAFDDLHQQNERLTQLDRMKDEMIGTASHELRTPLTTVHGFLQLLSRGQAGTLSSLQSELVETIERNVLRVRTLVTDLLDAERVDRAPLACEPVNLRDLLDEIAAEHEPRLREKGLELLVSVPGHTAILGDPSRLREVFDNLVSNAVKYTQKGTIRVRSRHGTQRIAIEVEDTGIGIPRHKLPFIFDRFYRADDEYVQSNEGTGLGLSIVRRLVTRLNGTITVTSEPGQGTTFRVSLPRAGDHVDERLAGAERRRVLVATADPLGPSLFGAALPSDRFDVAFANTGSGVIMRARRDLPHVVVLDLHEERLADVVARVRDLPGLSGAAFVVLDRPAAAGSPAGAQGTAGGLDPSDPRVRHVAHGAAVTELVTAIEELCRDEPGPAEPPARPTEMAA